MLSIVNGVLSCASCYYNHSLKVMTYIKYALFPICVMICKLYIGNVNCNAVVLKTICIKIKIT